MHEALLIALGQLKDVRAIPPLVARLTDKNYKVCQYAKRALKMIDPQWFKLAEAQSAVPAVIAVIWDDRQSKLREYFVEDVYEALGLIGDTRAVRPLVAILQTSNYSYAAVRPLEMLLESKAAEFDQEDLQVIAATTATGQLSHLAYDDWEEYRSPHTIYTDCQQLNQLAKQELLRRGTGTS